jgi:hypothetical protein
MKTKLLAGASALVLTLGLSAGGTLAQNSNANDNDPWTAVTQDSNSDAVAGGQNAVENGAIATTGNALGQDTNNNAAAAHSSTAVQIDNTQNFSVKKQPVEGVWDGDGGYGTAIVEGGSQLNVGDNNKPASADLESASATGKSAAYSTNSSIEEGSSETIGSGNSTATADDGGAAVGGSGTAVGIHDITIGPDQGDRGEWQKDGMVKLQDGNNGDHGDNGSGDDATLAFGVNNTVASAHLDSTVSGLALAIVGYEGDGNDGEHEHSATIKTGSIYNNSISSMSGANRVVYNTGIANQGRALAVAADTSFHN